MLRIITATSRHGAGMALRPCLVRASATTLTDRCLPSTRVGYCTKPSSPGPAATGGADKATSETSGPEKSASESLTGGAAKPASDSAAADAYSQGGAVVSSGPGERAPGGLAVQEDDEDNLPPLAFEPGVAGAAQKGVSAVVIAFGAAAFGACAWGISEALFPSPSSDQVIVNEAFDKVKMDGDVLHVLGSPLRAFGAGGDRGRRNAFERWEVIEGGEELSVMRFSVAGPQSHGLVYVQVPKKRRRGQFRYVIFEHKRKLHHVLDNRAAILAEQAAAAAPLPPEPPTPAVDGAAA
uniref:Mitochondrial import inner membrane translocase subunit Tim21 n=1 Tax=Coccolithus braarudii TaxID=221442 RepID=A0A7S0PZ63_9EUKA|mmetsp:Transcript_16717/g.36197  ORF Transcript_16717/g.36197 Transcript_16717/m.36197 type:complete len:295 (+) Transcript_16717:33-917(+)